MRERTVTVVLALLVALATQAPRVVRAQSARDETAPSAEQKREASAHFQRGASLFGSGDYRGALTELARAYEIAPNHRVLYNVGQTHVALGEYAEAIGAFEAFLAQGGGAIEASRRAEVEAQIAELRKSTAQLTIHVDRTGARVAVDRVVVGTSPLSESVTVNPGEHRIAARGEDGTRGRAKVEVAAGDVREVSLTLKAVVVAAEQLSPEQPGQAEQSEPVRTRGLSRRKKWGIGVLAGAGALGLSGLAVALVARSARDQYDDQVRALPGDPLALASAHGKLARTSIGADALFGAAIAAGATGAVLLLLREPKSDREVRVGLTPTGVFAAGRF